jgi:tetratricopeptide (TPR) repeat protein
MWAKMQRSKLIVIAFCSALILICACSPAVSKDKPETLRKLADYLEQYESEPTNCLYSSQVAGWYQALNRLEEAERFYSVTLENCPDDAQSLFQLGVLNLLKGEKVTATGMMDSAIAKAKEAQQLPMAETFEKEKSDWLAKWPEIERMKASD